MMQALCYMILDRKKNPKDLNQEYLEVKIKTCENYTTVKNSPNIFAHFGAKVLKICP